jgi:hypothetical protein
VDSVAHLTDFLEQSEGQPLWRMRQGCLT